MSAHADQLASERLIELRGMLRTLDEAQASHADAYLRYVRDARQAGWSWRRIGEPIGTTETSVRRFWASNRQRAGRLGG